MSQQATLENDDATLGRGDTRRDTASRVEAEPTYRVEWETSFQIAKSMQAASLSAANYREAFKHIAKHFRSPYARLYVKIPNTVSENVSVSPDSTRVWEQVVEETSLESQTTNHPIGRRFSLRDRSQEAAVLAAPIRGDSGGSIGAIGLVVRSEGEDYANRCLGELTALAALISQAEKHPRIETKNEDEGALKRAMVKSADFESLHELAFAMTNSLKNKFACDQVALGLVTRGRIRLLSISGLDEIPTASPGVQSLCQAMEESLDFGATVCSQEEDRWKKDGDSDNHLLHRQWRDSLGGQPVASVPLQIGKESIAVMSMTRSKERRFSRSELKEIEKAVSPFAAAIRLVAKAERSLLSHMRDVIRNGLSWVMEPHTPKRKFALGGAAVIIATVCFAKFEYRVTLPCSVAPTELRFVSAPFDATLQSCVVHVGEVVRQGQLLCTLDSDEILLALDEANSERRAASLRLTAALDQRDVRAAAIAGAEIKVLDTQIAMTQLHLRKTELRAPCDATIVAGDVSQRIGETVPLGDTLFELVPRGDWQLSLQAPESVVSDLKAGQTGSFSSNARPEAILRCQIEGVLPGAEAIEGKNVYLVDAELDENPDWLRSGMEGVTRVRVGKRPLWWIAGHRIIDQFHRLFWF